MRGSSLFLGLALIACQPIAETAPDPADALQGRWQSQDSTRAIWIADYTIELIDRGEVVDIADIEIVASCTDPEPSNVLSAFRYESNGDEVCFDVLSVAEDSFTVIYARQGLEQTYRRISE